MLWSAAPLVANRITGGLEDQAYLLSHEVDPVVKAASQIRAEVMAERQDERWEVFEGLALMFERGDRRVMAIHEFHSPVYVDGERVISSAQVCRIVQDHMDLYDEALALVS